MNRESRSKMPEWLALKKHAAGMKQRHLRDLFRRRPRARRDRYAAQGEGIYLDYSKQPAQRRDHEAAVWPWPGLATWNRRSGRLFSGEKINETESRPALHWALRDFFRPSGRWSTASTSCRASARSGSGWPPPPDACARGTGRAWRQPLAPRRHTSASAAPTWVRAWPAPRCASTPSATCMSISSPTSIPATCPRRCVPLPRRRTLFILASKTFTTQETMANAAGARDWLLEHFQDRAALGRHVVAVTANPAGGAGVGRRRRECLRILGLGGRAFFTVLGGRAAPDDGHRSRAFHGAVERLLGAMDRHFRRRALRRRTCRCCWRCWAIWHADFMGAATHAVLPYASTWALFPAYLQQLEMESNGKGVDRNGAPVDYPTGAGHLGRTRHQRPACLLPAAAPGDPGRSPATSSASAAR